MTGPANVSLGHNLFSDNPGSAYLDPTDLINTEPRLGPLADNGGPTLTQALLPGSPAIDAGVAVAGVTTDQRGVPRPQGRAPDIGAFEVVQQLTVTALRRTGVHLQPTTLVLTFRRAAGCGARSGRAQLHPRTGRARRSLPPPRPSPSRRLGRVQPGGAHRGPLPAPPPRPAPLLPADGQRHAPRRAEQLRWGVARRVRARPAGERLRGAGSRVRLGRPGTARTGPSGDVSPWTPR